MNFENFRIGSCQSKISSIFFVEFMLIEFGNSRKIEYSDLP